MNILEYVGFAVVTIVGIGALLWSIGVLRIDANLTVDKDK